MNKLITRHFTLWCFCILVSNAYAETKHGLLSIPNPELQFLSHAKFLKPMPPEKKMSLIVNLKPRNKSALDKLVQDIYDQKSRKYQQFLTLSQYEAQYAPSHQTEDSIQQYFLSHGMKSKVIFHRIHVFGTVAQIEKALKVKLNYYQFKNKTVYANHRPIQLPIEIGQQIIEISGISNLPLFHENIEHASVDNLRPSANPTNVSLTGLTGQQLQNTYNLSNIPKIHGQKLDGTGQTLVITGLCGSNTTQDIVENANAYFKQNKIYPFYTYGPLKNFAVINPDGSPFTQCSGNNGYSDEINLEVQASHTIAPGDNTVLVLSNSPKAALITVIDTLVNNNFSIAGFTNAYVISNGWGGPESTYDTSLEYSLELAAASGISINFSSGDCGDNTYLTDTKCLSPRSSTPTVDYPSSSTYVTAVGATSIFVNQNYQYAFETVWGSLKNNNSLYQYAGGTGGGISTLYGPVVWQNPISSFYAGGYGAINTKGNMRALPDIAMLGDPETGLIIRSNGAQDKDGGTSLACSLFSATLTLINQARYLLNKTSAIGQAAPYLYTQNTNLQAAQSLRLIIPPFQNMSGTMPPPVVAINGTPAPASSFSITDKTFGWDSSLTVEPEPQFWSDAVGVGSPNIPKFVMSMANF